MKVGELRNLVSSHPDDWEVTDKAGKPLSVKATARQDEKSKTFSLAVEVEAAADAAPAKSK